MNHPLCITMNEQFETLMEKCNKMNKTNFANRIECDEYYKLFHELKTELVACIAEDITESDTAYYLEGNFYFDVSQLTELLSCAFDHLRYEISFSEWFDRFRQGTVTDLDINEIYYKFKLMNESGSLFTYAKISTTDDISERIKETKMWLYKYAKNEGTDVNEKMVLKEAMCHFYLKIGKYYFYGINLDCPFDE